MQEHAPAEGSPAIRCLLRHADHASGVPAQVIYFTVIFGLQWLMGPADPKVALRLASRPRRLLRACVPTGPQVYHR